MSRRLAGLLALSGALTVLAVPVSAQMGEPPLGPPPGGPPIGGEGMPPFPPPFPEDIAPCEPGEDPMTSLCIPAFPGPPPMGAEDDGLPSLKGGFLSKVWRFDADADSYDAATDVLNVTITEVLNLPKRFADQDDPFVDSDAYVLFTSKTRVYDAEGDRVPRETAYDALLDAADSLRVVGKVVAPPKWQEDEDGMPAPTLRAKRVRVTD
jgi:hypothetical protein